MYNINLFLQVFHLHPGYKKDVGDKTYLAIDMLIHREPDGVNHLGRTLNS